MSPSLDRQVPAPMHRTDSSESQALLGRSRAPVLEDDDEAFPPTRVKPRPGLDADPSRHGSLSRGFYAYSIASECWIIAAGTLFIPVVLETYARSNGRLGPDFVVPCPGTGDDDGSGAGAREVGDAVQRCAVWIVASWVDTASFSLVVYSASVAVQALTVISMGVLADDPETRHRLLTTFALVGSLSTISFLFLPSTSSLWPLCAVLALVANVSFGASGVCLNSYLPSLAQLSPTVASARSRLDSSLSTYLTLRSDPDPDSSALLRSSQTLAQDTALYSRTKSAETSRVSSRGIAFGYAAGILVLVGLLPVVSILGKRGRAGDEPGVGEADPTWPLRVAIAISGTCWLVGSIYASFLLKPPSSHTRAGSSRTIHSDDWRESVKSSWSGLGKTLREWRRLPQTFIFLSAWFLLSDSFATLTSTAMLFGRTTLNLPTSSLILVAILTPLSGILGALAFPFLQHRYFDMTNQSTLILLVGLATLVPVFGLVSLSTAGQLYALAIVFGTVYGSFQSYSRTCFSALIPVSQAARFMALYSITDKSSSFLGPLLVAAITNSTGEIRHGFYLILLFFLVSIPILHRVDMDAGSRDADQFEKELEREGLVDEDGFEGDRVYDVDGSTESRS